MRLTLPSTAPELRVWSRGAGGAGAAVGCAVPSSEPLTTADLDGIGRSAFDVDDQLAVAGELVDAVDQDRLADKADTGYALMLAAEITEQAGDLRAAQVLAARAVEAYRVHGDAGYGFPRAFHAGLLLRLGREQEAWSELSRLRPLLTRDPSAVAYVVEALEAGGQDEIAEQWLSAAVETVLARRDESISGSDPDYELTAVAFALTQQRHRLRRDLDLPHDELDDLADRLQDAMHGVLGEHEDEDEDEDPAAAGVLFWPRVEFDRLLVRWPVLAEAYGRTWDEHRGEVERGLLRWSQSGVTQLAVLAGSVDELAGFAARHGGDPSDPQVREDYAQHLEEHPRERAWPPGRNESCWCGSGLKYKKCCLPRSRDLT
jgi:hypothetical protein